MAFNFQNKSLEKLLDLPLPRKRNQKDPLLHQYLKTKDRQGIAETEKKKKRSKKRKRNKQL